MNSVCLTNAEAGALQLTLLVPSIRAALEKWVMLSSLVIVTRDTNHDVIFLSFWQLQREMVKLIHICRHPSAQVPWEPLMESQLCALGVYLAADASKTSITWEWNAINHLPNLQQALTKLLQGPVRPPVQTQLPTLAVPIAQARALISELADLLGN